MKIITKNDLINLLKQVNRTNIEAIQNQQIGRISTLFIEQCTRIFYYLQCDYSDISNELKHITTLYTSATNTPEWWYITSVIFVLNKLNRHMKNNHELLDDKENLILNTTISGLTIIGIKSKLINELPTRIRKRFTEIEYVQNDPYYEYNILKCTTVALCEFLLCSEFRTSIIPYTLRPTLVGLHQIGYWWPSGQASLKDYLLCNLFLERTLALDLLGNLQDIICTTIFISELVNIIEPRLNWFKDGIVNTITHILPTSNGLDQFLDVMFNDHKDSSLYQVLEQIVQCEARYPNFRKESMKRTYQLMEKYKDKNSLYKMFFELVVNHKTSPITDLFDLLTKITLDMNNSEKSITSLIQPVLEVVCTVSTEEIFARWFSGGIKDELRSCLHYFFRIFYVTSSQLDSLDPVLKTIHTQCKTLLCWCIKNENENRQIDLFDNLILEYEGFLRDMLLFEPHVVLTIKDKDLVLKYTDPVCKWPIFERIDLMVNLFLDDDILLERFFLYVLSCLYNIKHYFTMCGLLSMKKKVASQCRLAVFKRLSALAGLQSVQKLISDSPEKTIKFIDNVLEESLRNNIHMLSFDSNEFNSLFGIILILNSLLQRRQNIKSFKILIKPLQLIGIQMNHKELSELIKSILNHIWNSRNNFNIQEVQKTQFDILVDDLFDSSEFTRADTLFKLKMSVEERYGIPTELEAMVLTLYQQYIRSTSPNFYIQDIKGLAARAHMFPFVVRILCQLYSELSEMDNNEKNTFQMKVGDAIVIATKVLGDSASQHDRLLLSTFLDSTRHVDNLIRCSSLSNIGKICRLLRYRVGSIMKSILYRIRVIIKTNKVTTVRQAAVTLLRQLLAGLENEIITYYKDEILSIFKVLRKISSHNNNDFLRLETESISNELCEKLRNFIH